MIQNLLNVTGILHLVPGVAIVLLGLIYSDNTLILTGTGLTVGGIVIFSITLTEYGSGLKDYIFSKL